VRLTTCDEQKNLWCAIGTKSTLVHDRYGGGHRRREDVAGLKNVVAWESDPSLAENPSVPEVPKVPRFDLDARNVGDALALLRDVPTEFTKLVFWDPQFRQLLDRQRYGNEGINRGKRRKQLPAMSPQFIASCDAEIGRILVPSGYCCRWVDEYQLLNGLFEIAGLEPVGVIHWNNGRPGMGKRVRPTGGSLVILQKPPIGGRAKRLAVRWKTLPMIRGVHYEKIRFPKAAHPHRKPIGLIAEIVLAVTEPGDIIIDPRRAVLLYWLRRSDAAATSLAPIFFQSQNRSNHTMPGSAKPYDSGSKTC
jgi:site-specific DNA-methyltransferase (adenine-specific)